MPQSGLIKYYWGIGPHSVYTDLLTKDLANIEEAVPIGGNNDANWDQYEDLLEHADLIGEEMFYLIRHFSWKWCVSHEFSIELTCTGNFNLVGRGLRRVSLRYKAFLLIQFLTKFSDFMGFRHHPL